MLHKYLLKKTKNINYKIHKEGQREIWWGKREREGERERERESERETGINRERDRIQRQRETEKIQKEIENNLKYIYDKDRKI